MSIETDGSDRSDNEDGNGGGQLPNQGHGGQQNVGGGLPNQGRGGGQNVGGQLPNQGHGGRQNIGGQVPNQGHGGVDKTRRGGEEGIGVMLWGITITLIFINF